MRSGPLLEFDRGARAHHISLPRDGERLLRHPFVGSNNSQNKDDPALYGRSELLAIPHADGKIFTDVTFDPGYQASV